MANRIVNWLRARRAAIQNLFRSSGTTPPATPSGPTPPSNRPAPRGPADVRENTKLYWVLWYVGLAIIVAGIFVAKLLWGVLTLYEQIDLGQSALILVGLYIVLSLKEVSANEVGAAFCYGKALTELKSGLHFIPFGLMQIRKGPRWVQEFQCPGEPESVFKGDDKEKLPEGMVRPIRMVTGDANPKSTDPVLNSRMTITLSFFVQWAVTHVLQYASNYGTGEQVEKQVRDIGEAILAEYATQHSAASFIDALKSINACLTREVQKGFKNSGVRIISTRLISPDVSHDVSKDLAGIPQARAKAEQTMITAEGKKVQLTREGEGAAAAKKAMLIAEAEGTKKKMDALGVGGDAILAAESVKEILGETDVLLMGQGGAADAMKLVKSAQAVLQSGPGRKPKPNQPNQPNQP